MVEYEMEDIITDFNDSCGLIGQFISGVSVKFKCSDKYAIENIDDVMKIKVLCELIKQIVDNNIPINVIMDYTKPKKRKKK